MNYLITGIGEPFFTNWYVYENSYIEGMTIFNLSQGTYSIDGKNWKPILQDSL